LIKFPSKKIVLFFVLATTVVGVIFWYIGRDNSPLSYSAETKAGELSILPASDYGNQDSDGDGLKDWEELLYGTDPNNPDTNGNGVPDKQEITERGDNQHPLTATGTGSQNKTDGGNINKTEELGFNLINELLAMQQAGTLNSDSISDLSNSTINNLFAESNIKAYLKSDIKISKSNAGQEILQYANSFLVSFKKLSSVVESVPTNIRNFNNFSDPSFKAQIEKMGSAYNDLASDLLNLAVPEEIANLHLLIINNQIRMGFYLSQISNINDDPIGALISVRKFEETFAQQSTLFQNLENYFKSRGIISSNNQNSFILKSQ